MKVHEGPKITLFYYTIHQRWPLVPEVGRCVGHQGHLSGCGGGEGDSLSS